MSSRVRERLRAVADRLPPRVRRGLVRGVRRAQAGRPQVSAVVLLTGPEGHARATLDAVRAQPEATLEILPVVMDPRLRPLADTAAEEDWRVRPAVVADHLADDWARARELGSCRRTDTVAALPLPASAAPARSSRDPDGRTWRGPDGRARRARGLCCAVVAHPAPRAAPGPARAVGQDRGRRRAGRADRRGLLAGRGVLRGRQSHLARRCLTRVPGSSRGSRTRCRRSRRGSRPTARC